MKTFTRFNSTSTIVEVETSTNEARVTKRALLEYQDNGKFINWAFRSAAIGKGVEQILYALSRLPCPMREVEVRYISHPSIPQDKIDTLVIVGPCGGYVFGFEDNCCYYGYPLTRTEFRYHERRLKERGL